MGDNKNLEIDDDLLREFEAAVEAQSYKGNQSGGEAQILIDDPLEKVLIPVKDRKIETEKAIDEIEIYFSLVHSNRDRLLILLEKVFADWQAFAGQLKIKLKIRDLNGAELNNLELHQVRIDILQADSPLSVFAISSPSPRVTKFSIADNHSLRKFELDQIDLIGKFLIIDLKKAVLAM